MAYVKIDESKLTDIADAIRSKNGETEKYTPTDMPEKINAISTSGGGGFYCNLY